MKQKLRILTLSFLLIMQSFFGLTPITLAEESGENVVETEVVDDSGSEETVVEEEETKPDSGEQEQAGSEGSEEEAIEEAEAEPGSNEESEAVEEETDDESKEEEAVEEDSDPETVEEEDLEAVEKPANKPMALAAAGVMPPEDVMKSTEFIVGGQTVIGNGPVTVQNGQTAQFKFDLALDAGHSYGPGTTMTYTLPDIFTDITFPQGQKFGDLGDITKNGNSNDITITFNENIHDGLNGTAFEPGAHFYIAATFNNTGNYVNETIDLPGQDNIELKFTPLNGTPITKGNGTPSPTNQNSEHIEWKVTVNTDLKASGNVEFKDTLTATNGSGHKFDTNSVTITELTMKPDGTELSRSDVTGDYSPSFPTNTVMTINLNGTKAYEITYNTIPDDPGNNDSVTYLNSAQYGTANAGTKNATVQYGTPLNKRGSLNTSNLETTWTIEYNYNKRTISQANAKLTDSWEIQGGSSFTDVEHEIVYTGADPKNGFTVTDSNNATVTDFTVTLDGDTGFILEFGHPVLDAYTIVYKTKPSSDTFITDNMSIKNTVVREDGIESKNNPTIPYNKKTFMLNKEATGTPNYENKTMRWTITANQAGYDLDAGTTFTDTFTNQNMTLKPETLVVTVGDTPLVRNTGYTLTNNDKVGFDITLTDATNERVVIMYTTDYDIKDIGSNTREFHNNVVINNSGLPAAPSDSAEHTVDQKQTANGKKDGKYNYATKEFEWEVELNFNYNTLTDAIFEDVLPNTQTIDVDSIKVVKGTLNTAGVFQPGTEVSVTNTATEPNKIQFSLGTISEPHKVTYTSYDTDGVFPETAGKVQITNSATLKDGSTPNASWTKTVRVNYTDKLIKKSGSQINQTAGIRWNFEFNYAQSELKNVVITDTVGKDGEGNPNQLIKPDSFKVYQVALSGKSDSAGFNAGANIPANRTEIFNFELDVDIQAGTFELKLPDGDSAYYIEYETIYMGDYDSTVQNAVQVNYVSSDGNNASNSASISNFRYGNAGNTVKVPFVVVKTDGATGEPMEDVEFTLYSDFQPGVPLISAKTNADGIFDLGMKLTEGNYTLKETTVAGYDNPGDINFKLDRNSVANSGSHDGKQIVEVENFKTGTNVCTAFTLTVKDVDGKPVANKEVTLTNKATGQSQKVTTDGDGEVTIPRADLPAGAYEVTTNEGGNEVPLGDITVQYESNCQGEVQPRPSCPNFTITVNDENGNPRSNINVIVRDKNGTEIKTGKTDADGKITVPSSELPAGTYDVFEGGLLIGEVDVSYLVDCEAAVNPNSLPKCPIFTLEVKDKNGKTQNNVQVTVKDKDGNTVATDITDGAGKVIFPNTIGKGTYRVYDGNDKLIGSFTVNNTCEASVKPSSSSAPKCPRFTLEVQDRNGKPQINVQVTVKDNSDAIVVTGTTNDDGKVDFPSTFGNGTYKVYDENDRLIGSFTVNNTCEASVKPSSSDGGGGGGGSGGGGGGGSNPPTNPEKPGKPVDPTKPIDPVKPGKPVDPTKPVDPENPEQPIEQENPIDPNNPNNSTNPNQPGSPSENGNPVDSDKLGQVGSNGANNHSQNALGASDGKDPSAKNGKKLPQTGEETNLVLLFGGIISIIIGASLIIFRRKTKAL